MDYTKKIFFFWTIGMTVSRYQIYFCQNAINLMIKMGMEGEEQTVEELIKEGGSLWDAVHGYALGGHHHLVKKITAEQPTLLGAAAIGYAQAQNIQELAQFNGAEQFKPYLVYGFSLAGKEAQIRAALNARGGAKYLPSIIEALSATNQTKLLFELIAGTRYFPNALRAAAKSGHKELVEQLLQQLSIHIKTLDPSIPLFPETSTALGYVLEGYSEGRHFPEAVEIMKLGINPMFCLNTLAVSGELDPIDASLLLSCATDTSVYDSLKKLMKTQFGLKPELLDLTLTLQDMSVHELTGLKHG